MELHKTIELDIAPLIVSQLRSGKPARFLAQGESMEPFLKNGDFVVVEPFKISKKNHAPCGSVLLYELPSGALRLHRFTRKVTLKNGRTCYRCKGDTKGFPAELIEPERIIGILISRERNGSVQLVNNLLSRLYHLYISKLRNWIYRRWAVSSKTEVDKEINSPSQRLETLKIITDTVREVLGRVSSNTTSPAPPRLVRIALSQGVLPMCAESLVGKYPDCEPEIREVLRAKILEQEISNHLIAEALKSLCDSGIKPLIVKGPALAALAYDTSSVRMYDDVDLLLKNKERRIAISVLEGLGWQEIRNSPPEAVEHLLRTTEDIAMYHPGCSVGIDIVNPDGILRNATPALKNSTDFQFAGTVASAPSKIEHFLYCAAHGAKHAFTRLIWLPDLDVISSKFTAQDWESVIELARKRRLTRILALACAMGEEILGTPYPLEAQGQWHGSAWLKRRMAICMSVHTDPKGLTSVYRWWPGLLDSPMQKIHFRIMWLFVPAAADIRACLLPRRTHFLYYFTRPVRLFSRFILRSGFPRLEWEQED
ncbi:MAG: hypothetical protein GX804_04040 [Lentisphaerae bacterium]|jgi:signal peptidase I|nr:hypothetical protein [Lentisphaerota bacterium]